MLTPVEKILFFLAVVVSLYYTYRGVRRIVNLIGSGYGRPDWKSAWRRIPNVLWRVVTFQPVFRFRFWPSLFHALIGWGFLVFLMINLSDLIYGYTGFRLLNSLGILGDLYRFSADIANNAILLGILALLIRRFVLRPATLTTRETTLLHPKARFGIARDSAIVATFILVHNAARLLGESFYLARHGTDSWQPIISQIALLWSSWSPKALETGEHIMFWLSLGAVVAFLPYFPYSKHIHLFFAPINLWLKPERRSMGELSYLNLDDPNIEKFGAETLSDLEWKQIMDAYACIMCFRCQEVCPAYNTGKILSPAALEINKRYHFNYGGETNIRLTELIPEEAIWACTSCGACVEICPVGNEPMRDILEARRYLSLMESRFPKLLENAFRGMERNANPWNVPQANRMKWAEGLRVPTIEQNPEPDVLWWVGCAAATDARAQKVARAFAQILNTAGVNYAVLGRNEQCTGDSARRAGREDIFFALAQANVEMLNEIRPKRIVTTCPHCLHTIKNEYPAFGGHYEVIHHTQLLNELVAEGKIHLEVSQDTLRVTLHDPCYLGRHNRVFDAPRRILENGGVKLVEMPRHAEMAFCCGAGGAQMWKEEEKGEQRVNQARYAQARSTGAQAVAVACPFCLTMLTDAAKSDTADGLEVKDVAEFVLERMK